LDVVGSRTERSEKRRSTRQIALGLCDSRLCRERIHVVRCYVKNLIKLSQRFGETTKGDIVALDVPKKSIAVMPFENHSRDPDNAYFADGIQDEILTRLSKIADLKVISRTSTQLYKSKPGNLSEIAKQLGVANILEGSVQKAADQIRVNVQLVKTLTDSHLRKWRAG
jgi:TolB-like protein